MEKWIGEACGNTFLVLFPHRNEKELVARHLDNLRKTKRWTFDTALALWPTNGASVAIQVIERDGSISNMCGNGVRVVGKILQQQNRPRTIQTGQSILSINTTRHDLLSANLGEIEYAGIQITPYAQLFTTYKICGEPHSVGIVNNVHKAPLSKWGRRIVPKANCTICSPVTNGIIEARTFERGVNQITQSCGTGACAAAFAMRRHADNSDKLEVRMHNYTLHVHISSRNVTLEGPAQAQQIA